MSTDAFAERFWSRTCPEPNTGCLLWTDYIIQAGYGQVGRGGKVLRAHRVAWELANDRPFPNGLAACHTCDTRACVNPAHIWPGTIRENNLDAVAKGRCPNKEKTHCAHGHPYDATNTYVDPRGYRECRECKRQHLRDFRNRGSQ